MDEVLLDPITEAVTECLVCGLGGNEDLVLLCDGPGCEGKGCTSEIHMYCLNPPLYEVPPDSWLCPLCNTSTEIDRIRKYLREFELSLQIMDNRAEILQQGRIPLDKWKISLSKAVIYASEFDSSSIDLIGCIITVKDYINCDIFSGRIIHRRSCSTIPNRYEHLVQFKR
jgi:hypothetical protein